MDFNEVMAFLEAHGNERTKATLVKHGASEPFFGVKISDLKTVVKKVKKDHKLSLELYATGNSDAMYLSGLIADPSQMTPAILEDWVQGAYWYYISEFTVPWVTSETPHCHALAAQWIRRPEEGIAAAGWCTYSSMMQVRPDEDLELDLLRALIQEVAETIHDQQNRVRHVMNAFLIACTGVAALVDDARAAAEKVGKVSVDMGGTACKVPLAAAYIDKVVDKGRVGRKRKSARC
ncbi:MAG: 3-methyladenine DNA glycosylase AlkD [Myxococcota bacterium]